MKKLFIHEKITRLLENQGENYIMPFFWQHGEEEEVLRHYMEVIANSNISAVCVESRPHPGFCGPDWWRDMDIIMDEARKREMKVWILDDSHFPTGYANGLIKESPDILRRQFVVYQIIETTRSGETITIAREQYEKPKPFERNMIEEHTLRNAPVFDDDHLLGVMAVRSKGSSYEDVIMLPEKNDQITWTAPVGTSSEEWKIYVLHLTRNRGHHRDYINMASHESCKKLIEAVYEPHYARYKDDFGTTLVGFFSDEPEFGNGHMFDTGKTLSDVEDQPWSVEIEKALKARWGENWITHLPLIWENDFDHKLKAKVRYDYMDVITRQVEQSFSYQIGDWCRKRGVAYIGHVIEDNNQHTRTGHSLGHFFRGLAGQDMAGIDNIGGQVLPQGEEIEMISDIGHQRDGGFFHYALGKLATSAAAIEPLKNGRAMCENFGNYGWEAGVQLMKYLADHFMVRGVNWYVPHAFSPKAFPDPDCPPHFYAHGNNPQYRHFGSLMSYMNRICELISDGQHFAPVAILYHAEADWTGGACMYIQRPAQVLADRQIDYNFIPSDVFAEEKYQTILGETLKVNTQEYKVLIVPETSFITSEFAQAIAILTEQGFPVIFINQLPVGICNGEDTLLEALKSCQVVKLESLIEYLDILSVSDIKLTPENNRMRYLKYNNGSDLYYFFNEGEATYHGTITVPTSGKCYIYNAWDNELEKATFCEQEGKTDLMVSLEPRKSLIVIFDEQEELLKDPITLKGDKTSLNENWHRSTCESLAYPAFNDVRMVGLPDSLEVEQPKFAGFVRYERDYFYEITNDSLGKAILEISNAAEGVELFVNGVSAGLQVVPTYIYDISNLLREGNNKLVIEVATTLERLGIKKRFPPNAPLPVPKNKCGLCGTVTLWKS